MVLLNGYAMSLRGRSGLVFFVLLVLVLALAVPKFMGASWSELVDDWVAQYTEAVESAQEDDDDDDDNHVLGDNLVEIDDDIADYVGVETFVLSATFFTPESKVVASVVDIRPILTLQTKYNQAVATRNVAKIAENSAKQELDRLAVLSKGGGSVASKKVAYADALWQQAKAQTQNLNVVVLAIKSDIIQTWGKEISSWVLTANSKQWQRLLAHEDSLLLVTLPADLSLATGLATIKIARNDLRQQARKAYFVSPALSSDPIIQGETYFFKTTTGTLRTGMRLDAWIPQTNAALEGVFIPEQAVIWYQGESWVYIQVEDDLYQRRALGSSLSTAGGFFSNTAFKAGEALVIRGGQMLLSEEFRWQILDEDDDD